MTRKERFQHVLDYFMENQPYAETELHYTNPYELIVAVILSAQCTDKRVNLITPEFFKQFPDAETLAVSTPEAVFEVIRSCTYPNNKAKHLVGMAAMLVSDFEGKVPDNIEDLQKLPGVGRKTANVVASVVYNLPALAVDTHVFRVSARIGLTSGAKTPLETEKQLLQYIPENLLSIAHHWLILHGRYVCMARKPDCEHCGISQFCKYYTTGLAKKK
ncbi:MAG TPA: endonuclease III [Bacteroidales bacterium]|nr:endonuclease III [Bacteroidales bacterium]